MINPLLPNRLVRHCMINGAILLAAFSGLQGVAMADPLPPINASEPAPVTPAYPAVRVLDTATDVLGTPFAFPTGDARLVSDIIMLAPGEQGALHRHLVPMFAYMLEGALTVDYGPHGKRSYKAGDALVEAIGVPHRGINDGTVTAKLLVVYWGEKDRPLVSQ